MASIDKKVPNKPYANTNFFQSLSVALEGFIYTLVHERNMRIHLSFAILVNLFAWIFQVTLVEWGILWLCIGLVICMEMINTTIETVVDLVVKEEIHPLAKRAKDVAAGAVVFAALSSIIIGLIIFLPKAVIFLANYF